MADDFVENILTEWGMQNYVETFRGNVFWVYLFSHHTR